MGRRLSRRPAHHGAVLIRRSRASLGRGARVVSLAALVATFGALPSPSVASPSVLTGAFAAAGIPQTTTGTLEVTRLGPLAAKLDFSERHEGAPVVAYDVDMTKLAHQIAIASDFTWFAHLHPTLDRAGHFRNVLRVPRPGRYYVFADTDPNGLGKQVYRFALDFEPGGRIVRPLGARGLGVAAPGPTLAGADGYLVALTSTSLRTGVRSRIGVRIARDGRPARDLRPYLGSAAHAVLVATSSLAYLHVHPEAAGPSAMLPTARGGRAAGASAAMPGMAMPAVETPLPGDASVPPAMRLEVLAPAPGAYVLWLQFRSTSGLHVARFVLRAA